MSRPATPDKTSPSLSLSTSLLDRARSHLAGRYASLSALVDAALRAHLDREDARRRFEIAEPLPAASLAGITIRVDHDGDPIPFQAAARYLYPDVPRETLRRGCNSEVHGDGCDVGVRESGVPYERVWATERLLSHEAWRRSKVAPPDSLRADVLAYCQRVGAPPPSWM